MSDKGRIEAKYKHLEGAFEQALKDTQADTERRHKDLDTFQKMVATGDSLTLVLTVLLFIAAGAAALYFPRIWAGDHSYTPLVSAFFGIVLVGLIWEFIRRLRS